MMMRRSKPDAELDAAACERRAVELLARREHSRVELERKLKTRGFPEDVIAPTLDELERTGALATTRFTAAFIRSRGGRGQGPVRIRAALGERGVASGAAAAALTESEVNWVESAREVLRKKFGEEPPADFQERARRARFLQQRGFDSRQIRAALGADVDAD